MVSKYPNTLKQLEVELDIDFYHLDKGQCECEYQGIHIELPHCGMCDEDFFI